MVSDTLARVSRRVPVQKRSKERFEKVLVAAGELIAERGADHVGMRELAEASGVPVATIYQYFGNREAVIATFFERESEKLDLAMANAFLELKRVDLKTVVETISDVHVSHHRENPAAVSLWFSGRAGFEVADRIRKQHAVLGAWLRDGLVRVGLMRPDAPEDCCALIVRLFDRTFEFVFLEERTIEEQDEIINMHKTSATAFLEGFATELNSVGVPTAEYLKALGRAPAYIYQDEDAVSGAM